MAVFDSPSALVKDGDNIYCEMLAEDSELLQRARDIFGNEREV